MTSVRYKVLKFMFLKGNTTISFVFFLLCVLMYPRAQNLVVNPGFEDFDTCILNLTAYGYPVVNNWINPTTGTPDYYNFCSSNPSCQPVNISSGNSQMPRTGNAISGIVPLAVGQTGANPSSEFIEGRLSTPLVKDSLYCVKFFLSLREDFKLAVDQFGVYFSATPVSSGGFFINQTPQIQNTPGQFFADVNDWMKWQCTYKASGGEQYFVIGNFNSFAATRRQLQGAPIGNFQDSISYYYIDDVSVEEVPSEYAIFDLGPDSILCDTVGFSKTLFVPPIYDSVRWNTGETTTQIVVNHLGEYSAICYFGECEARDTINFSAFTTQNYMPLSGKTACHYEVPVLAQATTGYPHYLWSNGDTTSYSRFYQTGVYYVTVSNQCDTLIDSIAVVVRPVPPSPVEIDTSVCQHPGFFQFPITGPNIVWYASLTDTVALPSPPVIQTEPASKHTFYVAQTQNGCLSNKVPNTLTVLAFPVADLGTDQEHCEGIEVKLQTAFDSSYQYIWNTGDSNNYILISVPGEYTCTVTAACGIVTASANVRFNNCSGCIYAPNAFSPNGDGNNDSYQQFTSCLLKYYSLQIFNRWGEKVFESAAITKEWDGTYKGVAQLPGLYVYTLVITSELNETRHLKGSITLIR